MRARIQKIKDNYADLGLEHPNGIGTGSVFEGNCSTLTIGKDFYCGSIRTSTVTKINDDDTFETKNSTYKIEYL